MHVGGEPLDLNIKPFDFLLSTAKLERLVHSKTSSWCCPQSAADVLAYILKEVKVREDSILNHLFPIKELSRRYQGGCSSVVPVESSADGS